MAIGEGDFGDGFAQGDLITGPVPIPAGIIPPWDHGGGPFKTEDEAMACCRESGVRCAECPIHFAQPIRIYFRNKAGCFTALPDFMDFPVAEFTPVCGALIVNVTPVLSGCGVTVSGSLALKFQLTVAWPAPPPESYDLVTVTTTDTLTGSTSLGWFSAGPGYTAAGFNCGHDLTCGQTLYGVDTLIGVFGLLSSGTPTGNSCEVWLR